MNMSVGTGLKRPGATTLALGAALGLLAGACFNPPSAAVQFACDPAGDAVCPAGYECRADGCCHREGTDGDDGACKLGVGGVTDATGGATTGGATTGTITGGATGTGTGSTTGSTGSTGPESTGSSTGTGDASTSSGSTTNSGTSTSTGPQTTG